MGLNPGLRDHWQALYLLGPWAGLKFTTLVEGGPKAPFSIATTPKEGATPFPVLLHFTLDPYLIMLSVK